MPRDQEESAHLWTSNRQTDFSMGYKASRISVSLPQPILVRVEQRLEMIWAPPMNERDFAEGRTSWERIPAHNWSWRKIRICLQWRQWKEISQHHLSQGNTAEVKQFVVANSPAGEKEQSLSTQDTTVVLDAFRNLFIPRSTSTTEQVIHDWRERGDQERDQKNIYQRY